MEFEKKKGEKGEDERKKFVIEKGRRKQPEHPLCMLALTFLILGSGEQEGVFQT